MEGRKISVDEVFLQSSENDVKNFKDEAGELIDQMHRLKESSLHTKRRAANLASEAEGMRARLEGLMVKRMPISPDYEAYQMMRRTSKTYHSSARKVSSEAEEIPEQPESKPRTQISISVSG